MKAENKVALFDAVDLILWGSWDPIGVNSNANLRDEYGNCVSAVVQLLCTGADAFKLTHHLYSIEHANMGLSSQSDDPHRVAVAQKLLNAYNQYAQHDALADG